MMRLESAEPMIFEQEGHKYDYDSYSISDSSPLATKEVTLCVDFKNKTVSADCVAYGSWFNLVEKDCKMYFNFLNEKKVLLREPDLSLFKFSS